MPNLNLDQDELDLIVEAVSVLIENTDEAMQDALRQGDPGRAERLSRVVQRYNALLPRLKGVGD